MLEAQALVDPDGIHVLIDSEPLRVLELTPFAFAALLGNQTHGVPGAEIQARADIWAFPTADRRKGIAGSTNVPINPDLMPDTSRAREARRTIVSAGKIGAVDSEAASSEWRGSKPGDLKVVHLQHQEVRFRWCPPGSFTMGSPKTEQDRSSNEDQVDVTLSRGFWMMETEVTQGLWQAVMGFKLDWSRVGEAPNLHVYKVDHDEAEEFGVKLTELLRDIRQLPSGLAVVLPTEAQWEYAARAGTTGQFPFVGGEGMLGEYAWFNKNSGGKPHEVKTRKPNPWNLHDMLGNVWEWCSDWYAYKLPGGVDPRGPEEASNRVYRGGCWSSLARFCRPANRNRTTPGSRSIDLGFRVAAVQG